MNIQNFLREHQHQTKRQTFKMVSNRLDKVHKKITKKKGKNPNLHEGSRDTKRLQSAAQRDEKLNRVFKQRKDQNRTYSTHEIRDQLFES